MYLGQKILVGHSGEPALDGVAGQLKKRRFEVIRLPYEAVYRVGGSFRCAHQPLIRI